MFKRKIYDAGQEYLSNFMSIRVVFATVKFYDNMIELLLHGMDKEQEEVEAADHVDTRSRNPEF